MGSDGSDFFLPCFVSHHESSVGHPICSCLISPVNYIHNAEAFGRITSIIMLIHRQIQLGTKLNLPKTTAQEWSAFSTSPGNLHPETI